MIYYTVNKFLCFSLACAAIIGMLHRSFLLLPKTCVVVRVSNDAISFRPCTRNLFEGILEVKLRLAGDTFSSGGTRQKCRSHAWFEHKRNIFFLISSVQIVVAGMITVVLLRYQCSQQCCHSILWGGGANSMHLFVGR